MDDQENQDNDADDYYVDEYIQEDLSLSNKPSQIEQSEDYELLKLDDFKQKREDQIKEFVESSNLSPDEAEIILINYNWNTEKLMNIWFEQSEKIKEKCGVKLSKEAIKKCKGTENTSECLVCFESFGPECPKVSLKCGHSCCIGCYHDHLAERIDNNPLEIICSPCPQTGCNLIVTSSIFEKVLENDKERFKKYNLFKLKNFTELNTDIKNCPNPKCEVLARVPGHGMKEIKCLCGEVYCFKCLKESHRPCDCEIAEIWIKKNNDSDVNNLWLSAYTKQCPKCKKHIEKNQGCNHMTCRKEVGGCGHEFCWICLDDWKKHGSSYYECKFKKSEFTQTEHNKIQQSKKYLERLSNYGEKYLDHQKGQEYAVKLIERIEGYKEALYALKNCSHSDLKFMDEAIHTVIDCRRMLKYTYALGYYLKDNKETLLYEHHQCMLDMQTDKLHELFEKGPIETIINLDNFEEFNQTFMGFRGQVVDLIGAISKFKLNLLNEIEGKMERNIDYDLLYEKKLK